MHGAQPEAIVFGFIRVFACLPWSAVGCRNGNADVSHVAVGYPEICRCEEFVPGRMIDSHRASLCTSLFPIWEKRHSGLLGSP